MVDEQSTATEDDKPKRIRRKQQLLLASSSEDPEQLMDVPLLCIFFAGRSAMTIHRWRNHPDPERRLPPPDMFIGVTPFWKRKTVIAYRDRVARLPRKKHPGQIARDHSSGEKPTRNASVSGSETSGATRGATR